MQSRNARRSSFLLILIGVFILSSCLPAPEPATEVIEGAPEAVSLATARVSARLDDQEGRVVVTGHKDDLQFFVDQTPTATELNEDETLLAAQATCAVFVAEKAAIELDIPLNGATATAEFDNERQQVHVYLDLPGADSGQVLDLANNFRQRCPIYTTLSAAKSIEFNPNEQYTRVGDGSAVVTATLFRFGGANVTARDHTFEMDSVPPLDGPNNELNPLDMMLGGLAACSSFVYEKETALQDVTVVVEGDLDPSGVRDLEGSNPRIQNMRIMMQVSAYDAAQADRVAEQIKEECYLYQILKGTVQIEISTELANS